MLTLGIDQSERIAAFVIERIFHDSKWLPLSNINRFFEPELQQLPILAIEAGANISLRRETGRPEFQR